MKFNFKKIASVIASTVMLSSTVALAAAAGPGAPFVTNGVADVAVVYGTTAAQTDLVAATDITTSLNSKVVAAGGVATSVTGGDSVKLERGSDKYNLGNDMNDHYASFDDGELSTVLADGVFLNDDNTEYKYEQKIEMGSENVSFFHDSQFNSDTPVVGFNMDRSDFILNYTLDFTPTNADGSAAVSSDEFPKLDNQDIKILGKNYYISDAEVVTGTGVQLTLLDSSNTASVAEGETKTITVGTNSYEVLIDFISTTEVKLSINGELTNSLAEGQTYKLSDGTYVGIKDISARDVAGIVSKVEFSLGIGKVVLEHGQEVKLNDDDVSELPDENGYTSVIKAYFTNTTTAIDKVVLQWKLDDDAWLKPGMEMTMPGFKAIKLSMGSWHGATDSSEKTKLSDGGDYLKLTAPVQQGTVELGVLYTNASKTGFANLGEDATHKLVTNHSVDPTFDLYENQSSYFVATWLNGDECETYAYEIGSITDASAKNTTKLTNRITGQAGLEFGTIDDTQEVGQLTLTLVSANDDLGQASVKVTGSEAYGDIVCTKQGLTLRLPYINNTLALDGMFNASTANDEIGGIGSTTWTMNITEEDKDGNIHTANTAAPKSFTVTLDGTDVDGTQVTATSLAEVDEVDDSDWEISYVESDIATKVRWYNPSGTALKYLELYYPETESYADVFVAETGAAVSATGSTILPVLDSETVTAKNMVVVGGSCVNTVAATLLGGALCGADFEAATNVGAGSFLIETFSQTNGGVATLVAGYNAGDTTNAATYFTTQTVDTTAGKKYTGTSATAATLVVA